MLPARRRLYPVTWPCLSLGCKQEAGWRCQSCQIAQGAIRYSKRTGAAYQVWLHAAHVHLHDTLNPQPALKCLCPTCHGRYDARLRKREARLMLERHKHQRALSQQLAASFRPGLLVLQATG